MRNLADFNRLQKVNIRIDMLLLIAGLGNAALIFSPRAI